MTDGPVTVTLIRVCRQSHVYDDQVVALEDEVEIKTREAS
jgi:hypothetical protein